MKRAQRNKKAHLISRAYKKAIRHLGNETQCDKRPKTSKDVDESDNIIAEMAAERNPVERGRISGDCVCRHM